MTAEPSPLRHIFDAYGLGLRCFECDAIIRGFARVRRDGRYEHVNVNDCKATPDA